MKKSCMFVNFLELEIMLDSKLCQCVWMGILHILFYLKSMITGVKKGVRWRAASLVSAAD